MLKLLERWGRLEPSRAQIAGNNPKDRFSYMVAFGEYWTRVFWDIDGGNHADAYVQAAVQEAIAARSWRWVGGSGYGGANHSVHIYGALPEAPWLANGRSDESFAKALLEAYLEALQADA